MPDGTKLAICYVLICVSSLSVCKGNPVTAPPSEEFPKCTAYVDGVEAIARSSYEHHYQGVDEPTLLTVDVSIKLWLNPADAAKGEQRFYLYAYHINRSSYLVDVVCNENNGHTCNLNYTYHLPLLNKADEKLISLNIAHLFVRSNAANVCFLNMEFVEKIENIDVNMSWKEHSGGQYELLVNMRKGYPSPFISHLSCDNEVVNTISTKDGLLVDIEKLRDYLQCEVVVNNSLTSSGWEIPALPPPPTTTTISTISTTSTASITTKGSASTSTGMPASTSMPGTDRLITKLGISLGVAVTIIIIQLIIMIIMIYQRTLGKVGITNNTHIITDSHQAEKFTSQYENSADEAQTPLPDHSPSLHDGPSLNDGASSVSNSTSGYGDEQDGLGTDASLGSSNEYALCEQPKDRRPIRETCVDSQEELDESADVDVPEDGKVPALDETR